MRVFSVAIWAFSANCLSISYWFIWAETNRSIFWKGNFQLYYSEITFLYSDPLMCSLMLQIWIRQQSFRQYRRQVSSLIRGLCEWNAFRRFIVGIILILTQDGRHFPDDIFKCIFLNENVLISLKFSLKVFPRFWISNISTLVQMMAWRRTSDMPLFEPIMVNLLAYICVTRPQWVTYHHHVYINTQRANNDFIWSNKLTNDSLW